MSHTVNRMRVAHRDNRRRLGVLGLAATLGCEGGLESAGEAGMESTPRATVLAEIDTNHFCDTVGVIGAEFRAVPEECPGAAPCAAVEGTRLTCPAVDPMLLAGVELAEPGAYRLLVVGEMTTGEELPECFSGPGGAALVEISADDIEAAEQIVLAGGHGPCPEN